MRVSSKVSILSRSILQSGVGRWCADAVAARNIVLVSAVKHQRVGYYDGIPECSCHPYTGIS